MKILRRYLRWRVNVTTLIHLVCSWQCPQLRPCTDPTAVYAINNSVHDSLQYSAREKVAELAKLPAERHVLLQSLSAVDWGSERALFPRTSHSLSHEETSAQAFLRLLVHVDMDSGIRASAGVDSGPLDVILVYTSVGWLLVLWDLLVLSCTHSMAFCFLFPPFSTSNACHVHVCYSVSQKKAPNAIVKGAFALIC